MCAPKVLCVTVVLSKEHILQEGGVMCAPIVSYFTVFEVRNLIS
jgi:hypothetical protein